MKSLFNNEKGYTLFLAVLIGLLFMIMATSLVTMTMNGIAKNDSREDDIQAVDYSEKGIKYFTNILNEEIQNSVIGNGISGKEFPRELKEELDEFEKRYSCDSNNFFPNNVSDVPKGDKGKYKVCIESVDSNPADNNELGRNVLITSIGIVDGKQKEIQSEVEFGAQAVPEVLNYAVAANRCIEEAECSSISGGNLALLGGVDIEGDVKVDGDLITFNQADAFEGGNNWVDSILPSILPYNNSGEEKAKLVLDPNSNIYSYNRLNDYRNKIVNDTTLINEDEISDAFTYSPELISRSPIFDPIDIEGKIDEQEYNRNSANETLNNSVIEGESSKLKVFANNDTCVYRPFFWNKCEYEAITFKGKNQFNQFSTYSNLIIGSDFMSSFEWFLYWILGIGDRKNEIQTTIENGMYVGSDLIIGNPNITSFDYDIFELNDPENYDNIKLTGPIYVKGDLKIIGAKLNVDAVIYVEGNVDIQFSEINGLKLENNKEGSLIVFSDGIINFVDNSVYEDEPNTIRGFFHSNNSINMYGVASNIKIDGGISAGNIYLNAIKGRAKENYFNTAQKVESKSLLQRLFPFLSPIKFFSDYDYYESSFGQNQIDRKSRLNIRYNHDLVETYTRLIQSDTVIYEVDPVRLTDRPTNNE
ncbi:hypothetical protein [Oceanobacillus bengalensis]|uniref:Type 4 fimbrial biogenesis protein PilX N-terminal domain-containing protein n=2 Tax=Oceanobacillus bengalensis TaxID=1435466 RepID=A0A494YWQ7_9BACI|nr:hypothetical protein D8M05_12525 [Oceanobacillus bengalensis]